MGFLPSLASSHRDNRYLSGDIGMEWVKSVDEAMRLFDLTVKMLACLAKYVGSIPSRAEVMH